MNETDWGGVQQWAVYRFVGQSRRETCNFNVQVVGRHPYSPTTFKVQAECADNCLFVPDWVELRDLRDRVFQDGRLVGLKPVGS